MCLKFSRTECEQIQFFHQRCLSILEMSNAQLCDSILYFYLDHMQIYWTQEREVKTCLGSLHLDRPRGGGGSAINF